MQTTKESFSDSARGAEQSLNYLANKLSMSFEKSTITMKTTDKPAKDIISNTPCASVVSQVTGCTARLSLSRTRHQSRVQRSSLHINPKTRSQNPTTHSSNHPTLNRNLSTHVHSESPAHSLPSHYDINPQPSPPPHKWTLQPTRHSHQPNASHPCLPSPQFL